MYKTVHLMKGLTRQEFVDYYEQYYFRFVATIQSGGVTRYVGKYPTAGIHPAASEPDWDCFMELWWESSEARQAAIDGRPDELVRITGEDEVRLFDLDSMQIYAYDEYETDLPLLQGPPQPAAYWRSEALRRSTSRGGPRVTASSRSSGASTPTCR